MGFFGYVREKKAQIQASLDKRAQQKNVESAKELAKLRQERIALEGRQKLREIESKERARVAELRKEERPAIVKAIGNFGSRLGQELQANRARNRAKAAPRSSTPSAFSSSPMGSTGFNADPFGRREEPKEKKKKISIIING